MSEKALWSGNTSRQIEERIVVEATLELETPAYFGNGDSDDLVDMPLLVDAVDGKSPLLTGSTVTGALRAYLGEREAGHRASDNDIRSLVNEKEKETTLTEKLFGGFKGVDTGRQSVLIIDDALGKSAGIEFRDGVKIDSKTRTAYIRNDDSERGRDVKRGQLFDMQLWQAGTTFPLRFELQIVKPRWIKDAAKKADYPNQIRKAFVTALTGLHDGSITLGGRKQRGFGRFKITEWRLKHYKLRDPKALCDWLESGNQPLAEEDSVKTFAQLLQHDAFQNTQAVVDARTWLTIDGCFTLDGSLLIRSSGRDANSPDMIYLSDANGNPVISGTSLTGVLRARSERIVKTLTQPRTDETLEAYERRVANWLGNLFGHDLHIFDQADNIQKREQKQKVHGSRLLIEESIIDKEDAIINRVQNRVSIDRFTGGARDAKLFNEQPVFSKETTLRLKMRLIKPRAASESQFDAHVGLLLLLMKDLWTGDLPIGGESSVGRGRLKGVQAQFTYMNGMSQERVDWTLTTPKNGGLKVVDSATRQTLEAFVKTLRSEVHQDE